MSTPIRPPTEPLPIQLVRKLVLLGLLMITSALGLLLVLRHLRNYSVILPHILTAAAMGLIAGFSTRWVLHKQTVFLRITAMLAFLVGGLELLGWFTGWQVGLGPLKPGRTNVDWFSLGQLFLGAGVALLALYAWVQPFRSPAPARRPEPIKKMPRNRKSLEKRPRRKARPAVALPTARHPAGKIPVVTVEPPAKSKRRRISHRKPQLQLSAVEEHRCPYCLEPIIPNDPRGTVECEICHTRHHADCWAITGACQVPHFTA